MGEANRGKTSNRVPVVSALRMDDIFPGLESGGVRFSSLRYRMGAGRNKDESVTVRYRFVTKHSGLRLCALHGLHSTQGPEPGKGLTARNRKRSDAKKAAGFSDHALGMPPRHGL